MENKNKTKLKIDLNKLALAMVGLFVILLMVLTLTGDNDKLSNAYFEDPNTLGYGHFENSPPRARFALTYSIVENKTTKLSLPLAKFSTPDLAKSGKDYVSLFAPGPSVVVIPGFIIGKALGSAQAGTFAVISVFAFLNFLLIRSISIKLGSSKGAALIAGLTFLIATPALVYAGVLYQHHISVFLILFSVYSLYRFRPSIGLFIVWTLCGFSVIIDNPNFFMMAPIGIAALGKIIFVEANTQTGKKQLSIRIPLILTFAAFLMPISLFMYYNQVTFGNKFQLAGTLTSVSELKESKEEIEAQRKVNSQKNVEKIGVDASEKDAVGFFQTRLLLNGMYIHTLSPDRGVAYYTPVILLGLLGLPVLYKRKDSIFTLLFTILLINFTLYSLWGDPWGGWAFGSRYLIPSYAILAIFLSAALTQYRKNIFFAIIFAALFAFSIKTNVLGAITTNSMPPKAEVLNLESKTGKVEYYTPKRGYVYLAKDDTRSFVYNEFLISKIRAWDYYHYVLYLTIITGLCVTIIYFIPAFKYSSKQIKERIGK